MSCDQLILYIAGGMVVVDTSTLHDHCREGVWYRPWSPCIALRVRTGILPIHKEEISEVLRNIPKIKVQPFRNCLSTGKKIIGGLIINLITHFVLGSPSWEWESILLLGISTPGVECPASKYYVLSATHIMPSDNINTVIMTLKSPLSIGII